MAKNLRKQISAHDDSLQPAVVEEIVAVANAAEPKLRALVLGVLAHEASRG